MFPNCLPYCKNSAAKQSQTLVYSTVTLTQHSNVQSLFLSTFGVVTQRRKLYIYMHKTAIKMSYTRCCSRDVVNSTSLKHPATQFCFYVTKHQIQKWTTVTPTLLVVYRVFGVEDRSQNVGLTSPFHDTVNEGKQIIQLFRFQPL